MTWDKKGLNELAKIKAEVEAEMIDVDSWSKLSVPEKKARHAMLTAINETLEENNESRN